MAHRLDTIQAHRATRPAEGALARVGSLMHMALAGPPTALARAAGAKVGAASDPDASLSAMSLLWLLLSTAGSAAGAYHGYKRNRNSAGWGFGWFMFGGFMPVFALPLMFAQGFAKPAKKS